MSGAFVLSNKFRIFNLPEDDDLEVLSKEADYNLKSRHFILVLRYLVNKYSRIQKICWVNNPERIGDTAKIYSDAYEIEFKYIQLGKPTKNSYTERFNMSYREMGLKMHTYFKV